MKPYETLFIIRPDVEEEDMNTVVERVEDVIKTNGGTPTLTKVWGKRRLAYAVKTHKEGIYVLVSFEAPPEVVGKLREHFRFNEDVIRNLITLQGPQGVEQDPQSELPAQRPERSKQDLPSEVTAQGPRRSEQDLPGKVTAQGPERSEQDLPGDAAAATGKTQDEVREG